MDSEQVAQEVKEMMDDRGYDLETAIDKVAKVCNMSPEEVREAYEAAQG
jgi:division protein CdvB (Snf7/Vps24/ESCRT-III family)